jgi:hypothetical protein
MTFFRLIVLFSICLSLNAMDSKIQVGGNYTYALIKPSDEEQSHGSLGGAQAMYEYRPANRFYSGAKLSWKEGDTECSVAKRSLLYIDVQERLGYTFSRCGKGSLLTLFSGIGYRYLQQHVRPLVLEGDSFNGSFFPPYLTSATDTKLKYHEFYIPVGFAADFRVNCFTFVGLYLTWMPQIFPMVDIVPLGHAYWALTNRWANFLVEVPFTFALTESNRWMLTVKPTYEYWQNGHSTAKTSTGIPLDLPGNTYQFFGVDLNFSYIF